MVIPNFVICGAPKAGTTALYEILSQHSDVCMSIPKETDFFQHNYVNGLNWFESCFRHYAGQKAIGEVSPGNMIHPLAAERIAKHIPNAKLIFILRNPIDRAYSQYWYGIMRGTDSPNVSFSTLIRDPQNSWGQRIIQLGMYFDQISRFKQFFQDDQLLILLYDEFSIDSEKILRKIYHFLDIHPHFAAHNSNVNKTKYPNYLILYKIIYRIWEPIENLIERNFGNVGYHLLNRTSKIRLFIRNLFYREKKSLKMSDEDRDYLRDVYRLPNEKLSILIKQDLSSWV